MNENAQGQSNNFELPTPIDGERDSVNRPNMLEAAPTSVPVVPALPVTDPSQYAQPISPAHAQNDGIGNTGAQDDLQAGDFSVIEKAWVRKAKQIIAGTAEDPKRQKEELSTFSAEYIKKRYGKDIKVDN
ncbi:hypothetical protein KC878_03475 [Candidatus Saccharibacteria bacterium]|nr:hypothetical protein [Candidatus Saccharibacteria bacterium]MCB9821268.1 hypothetical protein [Candidatus Nomurabacteria bacterium]